MNMQTSYESRMRGRRIILNHDRRASLAEGLSQAATGAEQVQQGLESYVDELAAARVDTMSKCLFAAYQTMFPCGVDAGLRCSGDPRGRVRGFRVGSGPAEIISGPQ